MSSPSKAKGSKWERDVCEFLRESPRFRHVERAPQWGAVDKGDLVGTGVFTFECKATKAYDLAGFMKEAEVEAKAASGWNDQIPVVALKRRMRSVGDGYAVLRLKDLRDLMEVYQMFVQGELAHANTRPD